MRAVPVLPKGSMRSVAYPFGSRNRTPECHRAGFQDWYGFENLNQHFTSSIYDGANADPTPLEGYETDALTDRAIDYIRAHDASQPLFLVLSVIALVSALRRQSVRPVGGPPV